MTKHPILGVDKTTSRGDFDIHGLTENNNGERVVAGGTPIKISQATKRYPDFFP